MLKVVAGVVIKDHRVLLLRKRGHNTWIFPGGKLEPREKELAGLIREIREETGCGIHRGARKIGVFEQDGLPKDGPISLSCWLIQLSPGDIQLNLESDRLVWVSREQSIFYRLTEATRLCLAELARRGLW